MKLKSFIASLFVLLALAACKKRDIPKDVPECIESRILQIKEQAPEDPPMRVVEYEYKGLTVYYIPASEACCDNTSELWSRQCNLLCHPDEGMPGSTENDTCPDFNQLKTAGRIIWEDSR